MQKIKSTAVEKGHTIALKDGCLKTVNKEAELLKGTAPKRTVLQSRQNHQNNS